MCKMRKEENNNKKNLHYFLSSLLHSLFTQCPQTCQALPSSPPAKQILKWCEYTPLFRPKKTLFKVDAKMQDVCCWKSEECLSGPSGN